MVEYAMGAIKEKQGKLGFFNFLLNITPDCDCLPWSDAPFVPDIGILASQDPVAIDHASYDLVNSQMGISNSFLYRHRHPGEDKFKGLWKNTDAYIRLNTGQSWDWGTATMSLLRFRWKY